MGEKTGISWCDHTFNPWIGCQKVSTGCLHCYAARDNTRYQWVPEWGKDYRLTSEDNWKKPIQWAKQAVKDGVTRRVFCASLADVFDANVPDQWQLDLWNLIDVTAKIGGLEWLLLTKRPENILDFIPPFFNKPDYPIRIGITCENQEMADKRIPIMLNSWTGKNFISVEPMLSAISFEKTAYSVKQVGTRKIAGFTVSGLMCQIDWIIAGCESGTNARPCNIEWIRDLRDQCVESGTPFFLKQMSVDGKLVKEPFIDGRQWLEFPKDGEG
jgi:protein gp37